MKETVPSRDRQILRELATFLLTMERFADHLELEAQFMRDELPVIEAELWTDYHPWEALGKTFVTTRISV